MTALSVLAQTPGPVPNPTQQPQAQPDPNMPQAIFRVEVVARTTQAGWIFPTTRRYSFNQTISRASRRR